MKFEVKREESLKLKSKYMTEVFVKILVVNFKNKLKGIQNSEDSAEKLPKFEVQRKTSRRSL